MLSLLLERFNLRLQCNKRRSFLTQGNRFCHRFSRRYNSVTVKHILILLRQVQAMSPYLIFLQVIECLICSQGKCMFQYHLQVYLH